jgi:hypothetical protein
MIVTCFEHMNIMYPCCVYNQSYVYTMSQSDTYDDIEVEMVSIRETWFFYDFSFVSRIKKKIKKISNSSSYVYA